MVNGKKALTIRTWRNSRLSNIRRLVIVQCKARQKIQHAKKYCVSYLVKGGLRVTRGKGTEGKLNLMKDKSPTN